MKNLLSLCFLLLSSLYAQSQITITSADMPVAPDTALRTRSSIIFGINYSSTGPNHSWTYNNLRNIEQPIDTFQTVSSTNFVYAIVFADLSFNPNRANVAKKGVPLPSNPLFTSGETFDFIHRSATEYKQVGIGSVINGLPLPITYSDKDEIYSFPLNFGDEDTSTAAYTFTVPGILSYHYSHTRINHVDGWGMLHIGSNSYNVLRVKSTILAKDSIVLDTLGLNIVTPRATAHEYKWLANGIEVPVLQINTSVIFGFEVISEIIFRDDPMNIETQLLQNSYCVGSTIQVPFTKSGTFNGGINANVFTAQLSDSSGSFTNPVDIGALTTNQSGSINATIPPSTIPGSNYRIRVIASNPSFEGNDNGFPISIINDPAPTAIIYSNDTSICSGTTLILMTDSNPLYSYQWYMDGLLLAGETNAQLHVNTSGFYHVQVANACDYGISDSVLINVLPSPAVDLLPLGDVCSDVIILSLSGGSPAGGVYSGVTVSGSGFFPSQAGVGIHMLYYTIMDSVGCSATDSSSIVVLPLPQVSLALLDTICSSHTPFQLNHGIPTGGTYVGSGITNNVFDPAAAVLGVSVITYYYTDSNGCSGAANGPVVVDLCTGIEESTDLNHWNVFPVPAYSSLFIESKEVMDKIRVLDMHGIVLMQVNSIQSNTCTIDVRSLKSGVYNVQYWNEKGISTRKFIKIF